MGPRILGKMSQLHQVVGAVVKDLWVLLVRAKVHSPGKRSRGRVPVKVSQLQGAQGRSAAAFRPCLPIRRRRLMLCLSWKSGLRCETASLPPILSPGQMFLYLPSIILSQSAHSANQNKNCHGLRVHPEPGTALMVLILSLHPPNSP